MFCRTGDGDIRSVMGHIITWTEYFANLFKVPEMCGQPDLGVQARLFKRAAAGEQALIAAGALCRDIS